MSEMLGNQYFIARRYSDARFEFENEAITNPTNYTVKKKLIICCLQTNQFTKAFEYFFEIVQKDISAITCTDSMRDDCPCPEIIEQTLPGLEFTSEDEHFAKLGILYLYCDIKESIKYFEKVSALFPHYNQIKQIITIEKSQLTIIN